ncbi:nucleoside deaminase [bacterium]|nr:MAG: nucleoside deaminase [bacterium]
MMKLALREAETAFYKGEIPVGCVIALKGRIVAKTYNQIETLKDPTAHAEILAITSAANALESKNLNGCSLYVTLEPCSMCAGAIVLAKIANIYFGAFDNKTGACGSVLNIANNKDLNHRCIISGGILDKECSALLESFFRTKR